MRTRDQSGPLSVVLLLTNITLVLVLALFSDPAHAQPVVDPVAAGAGALLEKGILGTLCVLEAAVIFFLFREIKSGHAAAAELAAVTLKQQTEWAVKATEVLSRVNDHLERNAEQEREHRHHRAADPILAR